MGSNAKKLQELIVAAERRDYAQIEFVPTITKVFVGTVLTVQKGEASLLSFKIFVDGRGKEQYNSNKKIIAKFKEVKL